MSLTGKKNRQVKVTKLSEQTSDYDPRNTTPEERWGMMWQLALDAHGLTEESIAKRGSQRHIVRVFRKES